MAKAPQPGKTPNSEKKKEPERKGFVITWQGVGQWTFHTADLGPRDHMAVRKETGMPFRWFIQSDHHDIDSLGVMIWMARRKNGEPGLLLDDVFDQLGSDEDFNRLLESDRLTIEALEPDAEANADDPLRSAAD